MLGATVQLHLPSDPGGPEVFDQFVDLFQRSDRIFGAVHYSEHGRYKSNGRETGAFHLFLPHVEAKA